MFTKVYGIYDLVHTVLYMLYYASVDPFQFIILSMSFLSSHARASTIVWLQPLLWTEIGVRIDSASTRPFSCMCVGVGGAAMFALTDVSGGD